MRKYLLPVVLTTSFISGCGVLSPVPAPEVKQFQIVSAVPSVDSCKPNSQSTIIQVSPVKVYAPFDTRNMYYSESQYQLNSYSLNQWATNPGQMITQAIQEKLQASCNYSSVVNADFMITAKYRITTEAMDFKQTINGGSSAVNLSVVAHLIDNSSNRVIKGKTFEETSAVSPNIDGYIKGANDVTQSFVNDLATWLSTN